MCGSTSARRNVFLSVAQGIIKKIYHKSPVRRMSPGMLILCMPQLFVAGLQEEFGWWPLPFVAGLRGESEKIRIWQYSFCVSLLHVALGKESWGHGARYSLRRL